MFYRSVLPIVCSPTFPLLIIASVYFPRTIGTNDIDSLNSDPNSQPEQQTTLKPDWSSTTMNDSSTMAEYSAPEWLIMTISSLRLIITVAGMVANLMVCVAIVKFRYLQNVGNYFVFNLALCDLLSALFDLTQGFPTVFGFLQAETIPCDLEMVGNTLTSVSVFFLVAISTDRFIFIEYPMRYHGWIQKTYKVQIGLIWIGTSIVWSGMNFQMICHGFHGEPGRFAIQYQLITIAIFAICFVFMAVQYSRILATARRQYIRSKQMTCYSSQIRNGASTSNGKSNDKKNSGGGGHSMSFNSEIPVKMIVGFVIIVGMACLTFLVFPIPFYVFLIFGLHKDANWVGLMSVLKQITGLQFTLNTSCNPYIYALTQKKYRDAFSELLKSIFIRKNEADDRLDLDVAQETLCWCYKLPSGRNNGTTTAMTGNMTMMDETCT
ncbi:neuropeptides capa receptor-like isoform X2 [Symsagittifera roscoffensis]|uniref:neuropeptides capa receptor-like isoform X2 n=1 Tax=Symsagittifera roscoffensis TaxID=84072 RepID=UPI00307B29F2